MRRLLIFSVIALVGTGFWLFNHEYSNRVKVAPNSTVISLVEEQADSAQSELSSWELLDVFYEISHDGINQIPEQNFEVPPVQLNVQSIPEFENQIDFKEWALKPEFREVKNINPPIKGVNPPSNAVLVEPDIIQNGGIINLGFRAFLHLPAHALVDEFGHAIKEPVKISYCPLSDPIDVFLSGIPMKYDSAGGSETFRTAGMVRLEATTYSGKRVSLKSGTEMKLDMPTVDSSDDYNFYDFDESKGAWEFISAAPPARPLIDLMLDTTGINYDFDTLNFASKFSNSAYHYLVNADSKYDKVGARPKRWSFGSKEREMRQALYATRFNATNLIKLKPRIVVSGYDEGHVPIRTLRFKVSGNGPGNRFFAELRNFNAFNFSLDGLEDLRAFYREFGSAHHFHDIRIQYSKFDDFCTILLKDEKGIRRLKANIHTGPRSVVSYLTKARFYRTFLRYQKDLAKKEEVHNKIVKFRKYDQFIAQYKIRFVNMRGEYGASNYFRPYRQVNLPGFATYNCDQIARMKNPMPVALMFRDSSGQRLLPISTVVCDKRVRASFTFYGSTVPSCSERGFGFAIINSDKGPYYLNKSAYTGEEDCYLKPLPEIANDRELRRLLLN